MTVSWQRGTRKRSGEKQQPLGDHQTHRSPPPEDSQQKLLVPAHPVASHMQPASNHVPQHIPHTRVKQPSLQMCAGSEECSRFSELSFWVSESDNFVGYVIMWSIVGVSEKEQSVRGALPTIDRKGWVPVWRLCSDRTPPSWALSSAGAGKKRNRTGLRERAKGKPCWAENWACLLLYALYTHGCVCVCVCPVIDWWPGLESKFNELQKHMLVVWQFASFLLSRYLGYVWFLWRLQAWTPVLQKHLVLHEISSIKYVFLETHIIYHYILIEFNGKCQKKNEICSNTRTHTHTLTLCHFVLY